MNKNVSNDIARSVACTRKIFFAAYDAVLEVQAEMAKNEERFKKVSMVLCEKANNCEKLRKASIGQIVEYKKELDRIEQETELVRAAKKEKHNAVAQHNNWEMQLRNARVRGQSEAISLLEKAEPTKPEDVLIPEIRPIDVRVEARGLVAVYDLSVAMNDHTLAIAALRECEERRVELAKLLSDRECELFAVRKEYEADVNKTIAEYERRERIAKAARAQKVAALKAARDGAAAELSQMGIA